MPCYTVTHVPEQVLPMSPVCTMGEGWGGGVNKYFKNCFIPPPPRYYNLLKNLKFSQTVILSEAKNLVFSISSRSFTSFRMTETVVSK